MQIPAQRAKEIIEGIRDLGCRLGKFDSKKFRIKLGGSVHSTSAAIVWYFSDQNNDASVNSKKAYETNLVRRAYRIFQAGPNLPLVLQILEWSAEIDRATSDYRTIWSKRMDERGAKEEMAGFFFDNPLTKSRG